MNGADDVRVPLRRDGTVLLFKFTNLVGEILLEALGVLRGEGVDGALVARAEAYHKVLRGKADIDTLTK